MRLLLCGLALVSCAALAETPCKTGDILGGLTNEQRVALLDLFGELTKSAVLCDLGSYQVITSTDPKADTILILRRHAPFVMHAPGFGINVFEPTSGPAPSILLTVQDWEKSGLFRRLDYALHDEKGNVAGIVQDHSMTGEVKIIYFKSETKNVEVKP